MLCLWRICWQAPLADECKVPVQRGWLFRIAAAPASDLLHYTRCRPAGAGGPVMRDTIHRVAGALSEGRPDAVLRAIQNSFLVRCAAPCGRCVHAVPLLGSARARRAACTWSCLCTQVTELCLAVVSDMTSCMTAQNMASVFSLLHTNANPRCGMCLHNRLDGVRARAQSCTDRVRVVAGGVAARLSGGRPAAR